MRALTDTDMTNRSCNRNRHPLSILKNGSRHKFSNTPTEIEQPTTSHSWVNFTTHGFKNAPSSRLSVSVKTYRSRSSFVKTATTCSTEKALSINHFGWIGCCNCVQDWFLERSVSIRFCSSQVQWNQPVAWWSVRSLRCWQVWSSSLGRVSKRPCKLV